MNSRLHRHGTRMSRRHARGKEAGGGSNAGPWRHSHLRYEPRQAAGMTRSLKSTGSSIRWIQRVYS